MILFTRWTLPTVLLTDSYWAAMLIPDMANVTINNNNRFTALCPPCSNYVLGNLFAQPLSTSSLVYLLVWSPPPHIPYISSPNQCLLFAAHAHTIATCFAVVSTLYHLFLVFLSTPYLYSIYLNITHPSVFVVV